MAVTVICSLRMSQIAIYLSFIVFVYELRLVTSGKTIVVEDADVGEGCQELLQDFGARAALFTFCSIANARPIKICEMCVEQYLSVDKSHNAILQMEDQDLNQTCKLELINLDRLEVIESTFKNVQDLWNRGKCNNCFSFVDGKLTANLSNQTRQFRELDQRNDACFINNSLTNDSSVCHNCKEVYCLMNEFYNDIKSSSGDGEICIDIVDTMNSTRTKWSKLYGCTLNEMLLDLPFVLAACFVSLFPFVFYFSAKAFSIKAENKLLRQSRLACQFGASSHST